jgi:hypothetical protein
MAPEERLEAVRFHQDLANRVANVIGPVMDRVARLDTPNAKDEQKPVVDEQSPASRAQPAGRKVGRRERTAPLRAT